MLGMIIPPSNDIEDYSGAVEFIQMVSTSKGLKDVLDNIAAKKKEAEGIINEAEKQRKENTKTLKKLQDKEAEISAKYKNADEFEANARGVLEQAQSKLADVLSRDEALKSAKASFEKDSEAQARDYNAKNVELTAREQAAKQTQAQADDLKTKYEGMIAELSAITSKK